MRHGYYCQGTQDKVPTTFLLARSGIGMARLGSAGQVKDCQGTQDKVPTNFHTNN